MTPEPDLLPDDIETLKAMLLAERAARQVAEVDAKARALLIEKLKHTTEAKPPERASR